MKPCWADLYQIQALMSCKQCFGLLGFITVILVSNDPQLKFCLISTFLLPSVRLSSAFVL